jgi:hypothetical protein
MTLQQPWATTWELVPEEEESPGGAANRYFSISTEKAERIPASENTIPKYQ